MAPLCADESSEPFVKSEPSYLKSPRPPRRMVQSNMAATNVTQRIKCVLVGDGAIGKTSLVVSYTTNGYPSVYVPTAFDNYSALVTVDNNPLRLQLCDTAGQDDFDSLRPLCYPNTDVFLICFSVVVPASYQNIAEKWLPEIRKHSANVPLVLVGTQCDLRQDVRVLIDLATVKQQPIAHEAATKLAHKMGAFKYVECSALTQKNLKDVFDSAIVAAMNGHQADDLAQLEESKSHDILSWGKHTSKKLLSSISRESKKDKPDDNLDEPLNQTEEDHSHNHQHSKVYLPTSSRDFITKKPKWRKLVCCI
ncbi:Rho-related GTP-binding protein RhoU [Halotydeus destructor]|nr:Rho-related GTP-binding protein RhoU [Halotydeus destructor]